VGIKRANTADCAGGADFSGLRQADTSQGNNILAVFPLIKYFLYPLNPLQEGFSFLYDFSGGNANLKGPPCR
jgi:hypothetical protein